MGPRLFSRGNLVEAYERVLRVAGFNGAAAFQPRKYPPLSPTNTWCPGFNGAAAFQPRK